MDSNARNRKPVASAPMTEAKKRYKASSDELIGISLLDTVRVISGALLLSCLASWFVTDGESLAWGYYPQVGIWRTLSSIFKTPVIFTDDQLTQYDGRDPTKPIYVAVNGSVFDVSANPAVYGPGGGYSFFAGRDAARAFVSGCFRDDLTWDLRGLEEMFITGKLREEDTKELVEINELREGLHNGGDINVESRIRYLQSRRQKKRQEAWEKVEKGVAHWVSFFQNHDKYFYVGRVIHPSLEGKPIRELCSSKPKPKKSS